MPVSMVNSREDKSMTVQHQRPHLQLFVEMIQQNESEGEIHLGKVQRRKDSAGCDSGEEPGDDLLTDKTIGINIRSHHCEISQDWELHCFLEHDREFSEPIVHSHQMLSKRISCSDTGLFRFNH
jgi:hypothetical protein